MLKLRKLISINYLTQKTQSEVLYTHAYQLRCLSTTRKKLQAIQIELDKTLEEKLSTKELRAKRHFGVNDHKPCSIPKRIQSAMVKAIRDHPMNALCDSGKVFNRYLKARKPPMEELSKRLKAQEIEESVLADPKKYKLPKCPEDESDEMAMKLYKSRKNQVVKQILQERVYKWQPIVYDEYKSLIYLIGRSAEEYAVIMNIFNEIKKRDPQFTPRSYFDFGSGVGTGIWAAWQQWDKSIFEYFLVDTSKSMNELSDLLLRDGDPNKEMFLRNVNHRQFLPGENTAKFDVVLSAYSMMELPSIHHRLEVANNLWNKTEEYLIFIESGTNAGFQILNEIRYFLLDLKSKNEEDAFVFAPCPHESPCPRYELNDGTPCNFQIAYDSLPFSGPSKYCKDLYSYLVIKKGKPNDSDRWPRIIRPTLYRKRHVVCRMCASSGKIEEGIFTAAKHGKLVYKCARKSNWGDQFPLTIVSNEQSEKEEDSDSSEE